MHVLVTAGNTLAPIDRVRCLTNIFSGRTGAAIALEAAARGHRVTLLTSHQETVPPNVAGPDRWSLYGYRTFDDLRQALATALLEQTPDVLIHCAAVSDYLSAGVYAPDQHTRFRTEELRWESDGPANPALVDRSAGKIKSDEPELWVRLVRAPKLVDLVRTEWQFRGVLVKFKLEVGIDDDTLLAVAERSRRVSAADFMVANTLEGAGNYAFIGPIAGAYERVSRRNLAPRLLQVVETFREGRGNG